MPKDITADVRIGVIPGESVTLPSHDFIANAQMTREGADLRLTLPDGHSVVVGDYFAQNPPPDLIAADGARLTPHLVDSFLLPAHPGEYAAAGNSANDASPGGKVTAVVGDASIIRADGTHVPAAVGTLVHQGDVIETAKTGAVNIIFADNTAFAVSENARMSVDKFIYDAEQHSGTSFFAMLQGAFVYTSGLIGKSDPGNVNIETPVGTIGIRGTAAIGQLYSVVDANPAHKISNIISVWEGAINIHTHDGANVLENHRFQEFSFMPHGAPTQLEDMDPEAFMKLHDPLRRVTDTPWMHNLFDLFHQNQHHDLHQLQLHMPTIHHGMLELHRGDNTQQAWGFHDPQQLDGGLYNAFPGGAVLPLSPLPIPGGGGMPVVPVIGSNSDSTFNVNDLNTAQAGGPEYLLKDSEHVNLGGGHDTVLVSDVLGHHIDFDTIKTHLWTITGAEELVLGVTGNPAFANHALLDLPGVLAMTGPSHTLDVVAHTGNTLTSFLDVAFGPAPGMFSSETVTPTTTTFTGVDATGTITVTLIAHTDATASPLTIATI